MNNVTVIPLSNASQRDTDIKNVIGDVKYDTIVMPALPEGLPPNDIDVKNIIIESIKSKGHEIPTVYIVTTKNDFGFNAGLMFIAH